MTAVPISFFWRNKVESATLYPSTQASATFAATNVANYQLQEKWRTSSATAQHLTLDFGAQAMIDTIVIWAHNLSASATVRVRIADNLAMADPVYDTTHDAWGALYGYDDGGYDEAGYDGVPLLTDENNLKYYTIILLDAAYAGRFVRLDITDDGNTVGYHEIGWLGIGQRLTLQQDFSMGANVAGWIDPSERDTMQAGNTFVTKRTKYRMADYSLDFLSKSEAFNAVSDMLRICGGSRPVVVIPYPDDEVLRYRASIYGLIINAADGVPIEQVRQDYTAVSYRTTLTVMELV